MARQETAPTGAAGARLTNARIAAVLVEIADLLEIAGESPFKVGAYRRAADSVAHCPLDVAGAYRAGQPPELRGVGSGISERLAELVRSGRVADHEALREAVPATLRALLAIPGVGPRTVGEAWRGLGIATLEGFQVAARAGRLRHVRGISAATEARILAGIDELAQRPPRRMLMGEARTLAARTVALVELLPGVISVTIAGSLRRACETVGDLDVLVETERPEAVLAALAALPEVEPSAAGAAGGGERGDAAAGGGQRGRGGGHGRNTLRLRDGPGLDVMTMPPGVAGSYLVHFTGSAEHNVALRHRARQLGWSLSEHGLAALEPGAGVGSRTFASETELYAFLGLSEVPPELREGTGELGAAEDGRLPRLITIADLRGDCHSHSDWSDGREPLEVMAESARRAGREYQVLSDHSVSLGIAAGLSPQRVVQQRRVIDELNERFAHEQAAGTSPEGVHAEGFRLLHGCELEITADGRLDYDDALLATFDVVVASLHVARRQPREQLMARYELAMRSPHVDIIGHPSGRKIGQRPDLDLDWEAFYGLAAETGTLLEINGSEERLDLDERRIRAALSVGCRFVIASDAHDTGEWQNLAFGVAVARRGWLEAGHVANTLPLDGFMALLAEKPDRR